MSVCGYHPYMGEGLQRFAEGLKLALKEKAGRRERNLGQHMSYEADEITILRSFLEKQLARDPLQQDQSLTLGFLGLVYICHFLMADPLRLASSPELLDSEIDGNVERLINFLIKFEDGFEECPNKDSALAKTKYAWDLCADYVSQTESPRELAKKRMQIAS
jgi:hypothetical protein